MRSHCGANLHALLKMDVHIDLPNLLPSVDDLGDPPLALDAQLVPDASDALSPEVVVECLAPPDHEENGGEQIEGIEQIALLELPSKHAKFAKRSAELALHMRQSKSIKKQRTQLLANQEQISATQNTLKMMAVSLPCASMSFETGGSDSHVGRRKH